MIELKELLDRGCEFFTGVPDSGLKELMDELTYKLDVKYMHVKAVNEAHAIGMAVGAELAGKKSCVYMQNSGLGNAINALTSLCIPHAIHPLLVIGHRHTLPQHKIMGDVDKSMLELIGYDNFILVDESNNDEQG